MFYVPDLVLDAWAVTMNWRKSLLSRSRVMTWDGFILPEFLDILRKDTRVVRKLGSDWPVGIGRKLS